MADDGLTLNDPRLLGKIAAALQRTPAALVSRSVLLPVGRLMQQQVGRTFAARRDPVTGRAWPRTSKLTLGSRPVGGGGGKPLYDTGALLTSLTSAIPQISGDSVMIGTRLIYATIHQEGGTIRPKRAKSLAIPLTRDARRYPGARAWSKANAGKNPFVLTSKKGNRFIATRQGDQLQFHFLLVPSVTVPQRRYLGWGKQYADEITQFAGAVLDDILTNLDGGGAINGV